MGWKTRIILGSCGLATLLCLILYSWQSKRDFQEWKRWDAFCSRSPHAAVRGAWCFLRPWFKCFGLLTRSCLRCIAWAWAGAYRRLDYIGNRYCPRLWDSTKRCSSHLLGTCWYASATAVVSLDNRVSESQRLSRAMQGRSPKVLRDAARGFLEDREKDGGFGTVKVRPSRAERGRVANPAEDARSYSSVADNAPAGSGDARSTLDSEAAWSAAGGAPGEWLQLDLGADLVILGIVTQGRRGSAKRGTRFRVQYRQDGGKWRNAGRELEADSQGEDQAMSLLQSPVVARHLRIEVLQWREQIALRAGALVADGPFWGSVAVLEAAVRFIDGWQAPFKGLRQAVCEEIVAQIRECLSSDADIDAESLEYRSRSAVNLGKESHDALQYTRQAVFRGAGRMELLTACVGLAEEIGAKLSHPALKLAGKLLETAVKQRISWALPQTGDFKGLQYALLCASALRQQHLPEVRTAAKRYGELCGLPSDWDVLGMSQENAYGYRMLQKVSVSGCLLGTAPMPRTFASALQSLLDDTFVSKFTRDRRDGKAVPHRLVLVSATAVQNEQSWLEYVRRREEIRGELRAQPLQAAQSFGASMALPIVMRSEGAKRLPALDGEVQEAWLFHGTSAAGAEGISSEDFRISLAGSAAGTLYGRGIYLAEACSKSDEYTKEEQLGTDRYLLLCRATLGRVYYTDKANNDASHLEEQCNSGPYHAVLGDREKARGTFREFIVYDDDQVYAAYILCYRRQVYNWKEQVKGR